MNPEAEQPEPSAMEHAADTVKAAAADTRRRAGVPVWRTGKPDAFLAAAVDVARAAVEGITAPSTIGRHVGAKSEGDRLVTHLFESHLPGYQGWQWFAVLTRNSRSKVVTVSELGLLPSEDSILAPEWVPWAERVRPEDAQDTEVLESELQSAGVLDTPIEAPDGGETASEEPGADAQATRDAEIEDTDNEDADTWAGAVEADAEDSDTEEPDTEDSDDDAPAAVEN
jgi:hypothetical protein